MRGFLRRLRGIIATGLAWAVGWAAAFSIVNAVVTLIIGQFLRFDLVAVAGAVYGFIAGGAFATILSITERRRTLEDLSLGRVALWGAIGGAALVLFAAPNLLSGELGVGQVVFRFVARVSFLGLLGAGFSAGSVAIARRADRSLIEGDEDLPALEGE